MKSVKRVLAALILVAATAGVGLAAEEEFPPHLKFIGELPVVFQGTCYGDADGVGAVPCEIRAGQLSTNGEWSQLYLIVREPSRKIRISTFRASTEEPLVSLLGQ